jgi:hypothetical protein
MVLAETDTFSRRRDFVCSFGFEVCAQRACLWIRLLSSSRPGGLAATFTPPVVCQRARVSVNPLVKCVLDKVEAGDMRTRAVLEHPDAIEAGRESNKCARHP